MIRCILFFCLGLYAGAEIVHYRYYPIMVEQAGQIENLLNIQSREINIAYDALALCREDYVKQHKNGRDFVTNSLGLATIKP